MQTIDTMRRVVNPGLEVAGMLISLFNPRRTIAQLYANQLQGQQVHVFTARIKDSSKYREATTTQAHYSCHCKPIPEFANAFRDLADELQEVYADN